MLNEMPDYVTITFGLISVAVLYTFLKILTQPLIADGRTKTAVITGLSIFIWLGIHSMLAINNFYTSSFEMPPRALLILMPPLIAVFLALYLLWKSTYFSQLSLATMTNIHIFRFPLELIVFTGLASSGNIPELMTFSGANFDIAVGLTAPIIAYLYFHKKSISTKVLLAWHIGALLLLINISFLAVLSLPYPFQQFGINQPNIAVLNFPFVLLPALLVSVAYFCHIISIHKILTLQRS